MASQEKKEAVKKVEKLLKKYPVVGIVNMQSLPTAQLQRMRIKLRDKVILFMTKKRLMKIAIENIKNDVKGIEELENHMKGMPALLLSEENPFKLFSIIQKNKSKAAAKGGQVAPNDIKITAGPTPFAPGPIISELGGFGLKTKVEGGKIEITKDHIIVKEGEEISNELASLLLRLGIEPMEIGLDLVAVYEDGSVFTKNVLAIDEDEYFNNFTKAQQWAFNLSIESGIINDATSEFLLQKAFKEAKAVALEGGILSDATTEEILAKAEAGMRGLEKELNLPEKTEIKEEKKEEKSEEKSAVEETTEAKSEKSKEAPVEEPKAEPKEAEAKSEESKEAPVEEPKAEPKESDKSKEETTEKKESTDEKVDNMVDEWKKKDEKKPSAEELVKES